MALPKYAERRDTLNPHLKQPQTQICFPVCINPFLGHPIWIKQYEKIII